MSCSSCLISVIEKFLFTVLLVLVPLSRGLNGWEGKGMHVSGRAEDTERGDFVDGNFPVYEGRSEAGKFDA